MFMLFFAVVKSSVALESSVVTGGIIVIVVFNSVSGCDTVDSSAHGHQVAPHLPSSSGALLGQPGGHKLQLWLQPGLFEPQCQFLEATK